MNTPSILIVDDEPDNFDVIEALLSSEPYQLHYVSDGQEAIDSLEIFNPDLILLDVMMPFLDGIEACQQIKALAEWQAVPIIMVTALTDKEDLARCLKAGADDFISKPVNRIELQARIHSMLRIKEQYEKIKMLAKIQENTIEVLGKSLQELRGNLSRTLPHELNTPLNGIFGAFNLLLDCREDMSEEEIDELLMIAKKSALRLERLSQRYLTYVQLSLNASKLDESGINRKDSELICNQDWIEMTAKTQAEKANRLADLVCNLEDAKLAVRIKDLQCIVGELVENACKFSQPGTPVTITSESINNMLYLSICDRGRGMTEEQIAKIGAFMQFERQDYQQEGLGLGLEIIKKIAKVYGGELLISSLYNKETKVTITLPLV
ncbi:MAG TPA: hybrid sensor histidine kinase/response regulator [Cyanobacteria bacterium UBA11149]|nr:hybrid sensor histidine kinase/response regulator [Cyanobacteria bacterium UBA11367]HBE60417.1 hybrid sensor histidine kinase/response regulator [Cyanobacteria bacterium UBA11366]HBK64155.1 hybrid sensor histidine kinase/response regulator [Cyanobacteria bacterium UBA11166]HBR75333.1 hybrid sensor histidine kinase/response regulator [Cyanobacteria bacterium UBA11159]HBS70479.1 hybrid sensor histidine kinase/response regulator [Cyanobacteria bacterium UBA11153]HBW88972.1 hybrid sensor histid